VSVEPVHGLGSHAIRSAATSGPFSQDLKQADSLIAAIVWDHRPKNACVSRDIWREHAYRVH
jgi:hypothetical protein